ncbi:peroxiredoxin [Methanocella sp. CWC-04]|uniref:Peroxiredoxin n=1 Tax=Methanooceanicella nereidis TaxID=2052831 RepID=A0AAP2RGJ3_9EURY|nr:redoxin domain-containing protein [Methanocella sp. CWC-04]MCD1295847.1 peroxiredoxin [Methanocella sp. CWC-04]
MVGISKVKVHEGIIAPMFEATDINGMAFNSRGYTGRGNLVLLFHKGKGSEISLKELEELNRDYNRISYQDGEVVAISMNDERSLKEISDRLGIKFKMISDPRHRIIDEYRVYNADKDELAITVFVIDKTGIIRYKQTLSDTGDVIPATDIANKLRQLDTGV